MEIYEACETFSSLSQETRLKVFKLLIEYGSDGAQAGKLASELGVPDNTLSFHLSHLSKSGLVRGEKSGRTITYVANTELMGELIAFLKDNCCARETGKASKKERKC
jgi:ArsR family transcriptional regulator, arsenate/arsenite/antimonite-responsive transcriptional repressor